LKLSQQLKAMKSVNTAITICIWISAFQRPVSPSSGNVAVGKHALTCVHRKTLTQTCVFSCTRMCMHMHALDQACTFKDSAKCKPISAPSTYCCLTWLVGLEWHLTLLLHSFQSRLPVPVLVMPVWTYQVFLCWECGLTCQAIISVEIIVMQMDLSGHASESMFGSQAFIQDRVG
jgi:hypothetical protein